MEWRQNRADCCRTISMKYFEMKVSEIAEESGQPSAHHMDLSFSPCQSRFKDKGMIYRNQKKTKKPYPLKQGCVDNIDFSCRTLTDKKTLWPRCGRDMLGLNRRLCLVDGVVVGGSGLFYAMKTLWQHAVFKELSQTLEMDNACRIFMQSLPGTTQNVMTYWSGVFAVNNLEKPCFPDLWECVGEYA